MYPVIKFRGIGTGAQVKDKFNLRIRLGKPVKQFIPFHLLKVFLPAVIGKLIGAAEFIRDNDLLISQLVQVTEEVRSDKSGSPGQQYL